MVEEIQDLKRNLKGWSWSFQSAVPCVFVYAFCVYYVLVLSVIRHHAENYGPWSVDFGKPVDLVAI